jgi:hypothetical protein
MCPSSRVALGGCLGSCAGRQSAVGPHAGLLAGVGVGERVSAMCVSPPSRLAASLRSCFIRALGPCPRRGQVIASVEPLDVVGDELLDLLQAFLAGGLGAQRQDARVGAQPASAPTEAGHSAVVGPFDVRLISG